VHRLSEEEGASVTFDNVLLIGEGENITLGAPAIEGAQVGAKITRHLKGDKVIIFKKKRRKGYQKKNGHRQSLTEIVIESIVSTGAKKTAKKEEKTAAPKAATPKAEKKETAKKPASKKGDKLTLIEGVGPKAAETLIAGGLDTFAKIGKSKPEAIKEILDASENKVQHLDPETWPQQAKLAADGKMDELKKLQDELNGGKTV
ncbi:50S ribosomal protein L21, partial [uncultured Planktosalinus sp.]|uniref:50S ribosomal protein L21 n=1 Tax=uncultured Planktosalinus sp. TaxID=1810935 RepID=UPI0030DBA095